MQEKSLRVLEFYKIREMLVEKAASQMGKERCASLVPESDFAAVQSLQAETEEASAIVARTGIQPISPFDDISAPVGRARVGSILSPKELLQCARLMQAARSVRRMLVNEKEEESETPHHYESGARAAPRCAIWKMKFSARSFRKMKLRTAPAPRWLRCAAKFAPPTSASAID